MDDRRPKKHAAAFVGRLRPPIALAASPALFARRLYNRRDPRLQAEGVPAICSLQRAGRRLPTPGARFCRRPRTALTRTPEGRADADARGPRSRRRPRAALTRTRTSRRPGRARVVFRHTALFQLSTAAKYGARRSSIALSPCRLVALSPCRLVALSPCRLVALSPCRLVDLPACGEVAEWLKAPHSKFVYGRRFRFCFVPSDLELFGEFRSAVLRRPSTYHAVLPSWVAKW